MICLGLPNGTREQLPLMGTIISQSAVWACTSCGACVDVCPVGNEPMFDILDIRRDQVLMQDDYPHELQVAFKGLERAGNPWGNPDSRMDWAEGLAFPRADREENPTFEVLCSGWAVRARLTQRAKDRPRRRHRAKRRRGQLRRLGG
jgi:Fe-S oxidoreductase